MAEEKSTVDVYINNGYSNPQYGIHYIFGVDIPDCEIEEKSRICDTITFREIHRFATGEYPDTCKIVDYNIHTREHHVLFRDIPISFVESAAINIANLLGVPYTPSFDGCTHT